MNNHLEVFGLTDAMKKKVERVAQLRNQSIEEAFMVTIRNLMSVVPATIADRNLMTDVDIADISMENGLVKILHNNGRIFYTFPSRQKYANLYYTFRDLIPKVVAAQTYQAYCDIRVRYEQAISNYKFFPKRQDATVIEGGGYVGFKALGFADQLGPRGKVIVIEIGAQNYAILERNIKVNNLEDRVIPLCCGIWSEPGEMEAEYEIYASHSLMPPDEHKHYTKKEKVKTDTLDNIIDNHDLEVVDFINLQINGAEGEVIKGLERNFDKVKLLRIGAHYTIDGQPQDEMIIAQLKARGCTILDKNVGNITAVTPKWASEFENSPLRGYFE